MDEHAGRTPWTTALVEETESCAMDHNTTYATYNIGRGDGRESCAMDHTRHGHRVEWVRELGAADSETELEPAASWS